VAVYVVAAVVAVVLSVTFAGGTPLVVLAVIPALFVLADSVERAASKPPAKAKGRTAAAQAGAVRATAYTVEWTRDRWRIAALVWGGVLVVVGVILLVLRASAVSDVPDAGTSGHSGLGAIIAIAVHQAARELRLLVASPWTIAIVLSIGVFVLIRFLTQRAERELFTSQRILPRIDRFGWAGTAGLVVAGVVAVLASPTGAPAAAVVLMAFAVMAAATTLDRAAGRATDTRAFAMAPAR